ncbi:MAG: hypothetical protein ABEK84_00865, partial [Salinibacter sp.]
MSFPPFVTEHSLFRVCGLLAVLGLLVGSTPAQAGDGRRPRGTDSLSAAAVAFQLRYGFPGPSSTAPAPLRRDRWIARDKAKHVAFSALWTLSTQYVLVNKADWTATDALPASIASGAAVGAAKELYDASQLTETASGKDLVADAVGIG